MPKAKDQAKQKHDPLHVQLKQDASVEMAFKPTKTKEKRNIVKESGQVEGKLSEKILIMAKQQQAEMEAERPVQKFAKESNVKAVVEDESDEEVFDEAEYEDWDGGEDLEVEEADQALLDKFMGGKRENNLSSMIMEKLKLADGSILLIVEKQAKGDEAEQGMNPKVIEVYTKVGMLLSRYKSGPLPKTFKIIPTLRDWEQVLYITNPHQWTTQACYQATRIFTSNLKAKMAQRFFALILLERVRDDIAETKKLNYHLYMSIKKSLYKPAAFFKGFLLPLLEGGDCTLREAAIIGSVLIKVSVPVLHSAAALLKIAEMEYTGSNSLFIRILLDKKYALPYKVIDSLVFHFLRFKKDQREMPVLWHQSFLVFCQRYKQDLTPEQKEALMDLIKFKTHFEISGEIRRELQNSVCRGEMVIDPLESMQ